MDLCESHSRENWEELSKLMAFQKAANMFQAEAKLSQANRKAMNDLVDKVNDKLVCLTSFRFGVLYSDSVSNSLPLPSVLGQV